MTQLDKAIIEIRAVEEADRKSRIEEEKAQKIQNLVYSVTNSNGMTWSCFLWYAGEAYRLGLLT